MKKNKNKISFVFDIILLVSAILGGIGLISCNFLGIVELHQYTIIGIAVLEALCVASLITITTLVRKTNKEKEDNDDF